MIIRGWVSQRSGNSSKIISKLRMTRQNDGQLATAINDDLHQPLQPGQRLRMQVVSLIDEERHGFPLAHRQHAASKSRSTILRQAGNTANGSVTYTKTPPAKPGRFRIPCTDNSGVGP